MASLRIGKLARRLIMAFSAEGSFGIIQNEINSMDTRLITSSSTRSSARNLPIVFTLAPQQLIDLGSAYPGAARHPVRTCKARKIRHATDPPANRSKLMTGAAYVQKETHGRQRSIATGVPAKLPVKLTEHWTAHVMNRPCS